VSQWEQKYTNNSENVHLKDESTDQEQSKKVEGSGDNLKPQEFISLLDENMDDHDEKNASEENKTDTVQKKKKSKPIRFTNKWIANIPNIKISGLKIPFMSGKNGR